MKLIIGSLILAALVVPSAPVKFEAGGVRVGDALLSGAALELREVGAGSVLASASVVESLSSAITVEVAQGRTLVLEPGVRVSRAKAGFALSTHAGKALKLAGVEFTVVSPASFTITEKGWDFGAGKVFAGAELRASLQAATPPQDPTDVDLETMRRAAERAKGKPAGDLKGASRADLLFVLSNHFRAMGQPMDSAAIKQLGSVTPIGF